jgi:threonine dehydrogenase-like Zn-dependent dehydrogenase
MVFRELQIVATIGMAPYRYTSMVPLVSSGRLTPGKMVTREIGLSEVQSIFESMTKSENVGTFVVTNYNG